MLMIKIVKQGFTNTVSILADKSTLYLKLYSKYRCSFFFKNLETRYYLLVVWYIQMFSQCWESVCLQSPLYVPWKRIEGIVRPHSHASSSSHGRGQRV